MIQIDELSIAYHGSKLFDDASFSLQEGERIGLVGLNGTGKSTLLRMIIGEETPDTGTIAIRKHYTLGFLKQHNIFTQATLLQEAALGLRPQDRDDLYKVEKILFGLGFKEEDLLRSPGDFSGGYHLRLNLTKTLVAEPNCLLLDEPTNYLDIVAIKWLVRFLQQWKGELIVISHDREFMDSITTHTMGIHRQKIRKIKGSTIDYFEKILQEEEIHEKTRVNLEKKKAHAQEFIDRLGAKASKAAQAQSRQKMLNRMPVLEKLKDIHHLGFQFNEAPMTSKKVLEVKDLCFSYVQDHPIVRDLSLILEKGERMAIIGKNGRGKSTILRLIAQDLEPGSGHIEYSIHTRLGYFGQTNIDRLHPGHTIEQEVAVVNPKLNQTQVKSICGVMMFSGDKSNKPISVLSGGERSRVLLGKILAMPCNVLLLDEPTHHLDMESIEALIDALEDFDGTVIIVTHSELILKRLSLDKILICRQGAQELFLGTYEEFLEKQGWEDPEKTVLPKKKENISSKEKKHDRNNAERAVKFLRNQIQLMEKEIFKMEEEQNKDYEELAKISQGTQGVPDPKLHNLMDAVSNRQKKMDELYAKWNEMTEEIERNSLS